MKKLLALMFVCAGLTAMAVNPVHHVTNKKMSQRSLEKGAMVLKSNTLAKDLTKNMVSAKEAKTLDEFVRTHDLSQNKLMKRAPRRASTYTDIEGDWIYSSIENTIADGTATPTWYSINGLTFAIDTIFEEYGYCEVYLGIMPFTTDPDGSGTQYEPAHYLQFPDCYAWYEPATDSIGIFGGWMYMYPLASQRSGNNTYTITASYWYTGIADENAILNGGEIQGNVAHGVVDWDYGLIQLDAPFGPIEAQVTKSFSISRTNYNAIANALGIGTSNNATYVRQMAFYLNLYKSLFAQYGWTYTETVSDSTAYSNGLYTNNMFMMPNAVHNFDRAYKASTTDSTFVELSYENAAGETVTYQELVMDSVVNEDVPVWLYQNETCDTVYAWNLFGVSNYPEVEFAINSDAEVTFPWQPVYWEDMTEFTEYYQSYGYPYTFTNAFLNFHSTYAPYNQDGVVGYYQTDVDWEDTPCQINGDLNEITWAATDIMDVYTTTSDEYYHMGVGFTAPWLNNKLTIGYALTLPEPEETWQIGDVNHDGFVNVGDVTALIQFVLGNTPDVFYIEQAQINGDTDFNVADVTALIQIVLNGN